MKPLIEQVSERLNPEARRLLRWCASIHLSIAFTVALGASPAFAQVYVSVNRGLGNQPIAVVDSDYASPTFNQIVAVIDSDLYIPDSITFTPDGAYAWLTSVGVSDEDERVEIIDLLSNSAAGFIFLDPNSGGHFVAIGPDGLAYMSGNNPNSISIFNTVDGSLVATIPIDQPVSSLVIRPDGLFIYATLADESGIMVFDTVTRQVSTIIPVVIRGYGPVRFTPDGAFAYVGNNCSPGRVVAIDTLSYEIHELPSTNLVCPFGIAFRQDGSLAYVTDLYASTVKVFDTQAGTWAAPIDLPDGRHPIGITVSPLGYAYVEAGVIGQEDVVVVIDTLTNRIVTTISGFQGGLGVINSM